MDADSFTEAVSEANKTALSRLGSSKALFADTEGELEPEVVLTAAADAEHAAAETYAAWADDETDAEVSEAFATTAAEERDHRETVTAELDDHDSSDEVPAIQQYLRGLDDTIVRLGGFVGRTLAAEKSKTQLTGYFTGQADPQTASTFRDIGDDLDPQLERATDLLEARCEDEADWDAALDAANGAIQAAYDEYTETLEGMGVNPKPVC
jgi:rubrerythrin